MEEDETTRPVAKVRAHKSNLHADIKCPPQESTCSLHLYDEPTGIKTQTASGKHEVRVRRPWTVRSTVTKTMEGDHIHLVLHQSIRDHDGLMNDLGQISIRLHPKPLQSPDALWSDPLSKVTFNLVANQTHQYPLQPYLGAALCEWPWDYQEEKAYTMVVRNDDTIVCSKLRLERKTQYAVFIVERLLRPVHLKDVNLGTVRIRIQPDWRIQFRRMTREIIGFLE